MNNVFLKDKVSVIIPIYNVESYLEECLESVLNQTYDNYEIILIDDGSTDNSAKIAREYYDRYTNITFIKQSNQGLSKARNVGVHHSKGEYILFLDSDDKICINLLEVCMKTLNNKDIDIIHFGYITFEGNEVLRKNLFESKRKVLSGKEFFKCSSEEFFGRNFEAWSYMYKRSFWIDNNIRYKEGLIYEDTEAYINIFIKEPNVAIVNECLYMYRMRSGSIIQRNNYTYNYLKSINIILETYLKYFYIEEDLAECILKYIKLFYREKLNILLKMNDLSESIIQEELNNVFEFSKKISLGIEALYIEKLKEISEINEINLGVSSNDYFLSKLREIDEIRRRKISNIPLQDKEKLIGIYGVGKHTNEFLSYYKNYIGNVECKVILIDSFQSEGFDEELDLKLINIKQIGEYNFDFIIISSPYSEEVLLSNLSKYKYYGRVYRLYDDHDVLLFG